jgi:RNA polymerase sigma-70 factor, ECF subfamily
MTELSANPEDGAITRKLVAAAKSGDRQAYDLLFAQAAERALVYIRLRLGPVMREQVDSLDVLQDAYLEAHRGFDSFEFRGDGSFARWLCRIIENRIRGLADHHGARKRRAEGVKLPVSDLVELARSRTGPATAAMQREERKEIGLAIGRLEEEERHAVLLRFFSDFSIEEVATSLGRSPTATRRVLARATLHLGELLDAYGERSS